MNYYGVTIKEIASKTYAVKADSLEDAIEKVENLNDIESLIDVIDDYDETVIEKSSCVSTDGIIRSEDLDYYEILN